MFDNKPFLFLTNNFITEVHRHNNYVSQISWTTVSRGFHIKLFCRSVPLISLSFKGSHIVCHIPLSPAVLGRPHLINHPLLLSSIELLVFCELDNNVTTLSLHNTLHLPSRIGHPVHYIEDQKRHRK